MILDRLHFLFMALLGLSGILCLYLTSPSNITADWDEVDGVLLTIESEEALGQYMHSVQKKKLEVTGKYQFVLNGKVIESTYLIRNDYHNLMKEMNLRNIKEVGSKVQVFVNPENVHDSTLFPVGLKESGNFIAYILCSIFMIGGFIRFFE